jgi:uncharacterized protein YegP (UPF0339 family)
MGFKLHKEHDSQYHFTIIASDGAVLATGETHHNKSDSLSAVRLIQAGAAGAAVDNLC